MGRRGGARRAWREASIRARYDTPPDLTADIGERPDSLLDAERWDRAAATLEDYRLRNGELPGANVPADGAQRLAWERARAAVARVPGHDGRDQGPPGTIVPVELDGSDIDGPDIDLYRSAGGHTSGFRLPARWTRRAARAACRAPSGARRRSLSAVLMRELHEPGAPTTGDREVQGN